MICKYNLLLKQQDLENFQLNTDYPLAQDIIKHQKKYIARIKISVIRHKRFLLVDLMGILLT